MMKLAMIAMVIWGIIFIALSKNDDERFACPNCGHHFNRTFWNTLCSEFDTLRHPKVNYLKCPKCKVRDECSSLHGR